MGSDVGQIFPTASLHRDHSISYALICEKRISDIVSWDRKSFSHIPTHTRSSDPYVSSLSCGWDKQVTWMG